MIVTTKDTKKTYQITLRSWDGCQWLPDCAGDVLDTWSLQQITQAEIDWLIADCDHFNNGEDLDWLTHRNKCQEVWLKCEEVNTNE